MLGMRRVCAFIATAVLGAELAHADEPPTLGPTAGEISEAEIAAARERAEARRTAVEQRTAEDANAAKAAQDARRERILRAELAVAREQQRERRNSGWLLIGTGAGTLALAGLFLWWSKGVNDDVRKGGFDYSFDIKRRAVDGQIYNACAWTFGVGGAIAFAIGVPTVLTTRVEGTQVGLAPWVASGTTGLSLGTSLP